MEKNTGAWGELIYTSFINWAKVNPTYENLFATLPTPLLKVAKDFFTMTPQVNHFNYEIFWLKNHMNYTHLGKQREILLLTEIIIKFITEYQHGRLNRESATDAKTKKGKAEKSAK